MLIDTYKILNKISDIDSSDFLKYNDDTRTRNNGSKLIHNRFNLDIRKYFFSCSVVARWYALPKEVVSAPSVTSFKNRLDDYFKKRST